MLQKIKIKEAKLVQHDFYFILKINNPLELIKLKYDTSVNFQFLYVKLTFFNQLISFLLSILF